MTTFSTAIDETGAFELGDKFFYLLGHEITVEYLVAKRGDERPASRVA